MDIKNFDNRKDMEKAFKELNKNKKETKIINVDGMEFSVFQDNDKEVDIDYWREVMWKEITEQIQIGLTSILEFQGVDKEDIEKRLNGVIPRVKEMHDNDLNSAMGTVFAMKKDLQKRGILPKDQIKID